MAEAFPVLGQKMYVDDRDSIGLAKTGLHEPFLTYLCLQLLRPGDWAIDVGANIGYYTLLFARAVGPSGRVIAFEPDPDNFALLEANVALNGHRHVQAVPKALAAGPGQLELFRSRDNYGDHRLWRGEETRESVSVEALALDDHLRGEEGPLALIKIDVQGAEAQVIEGMQRTLERHPAAILLAEFWPIGIRHMGGDPAAFLERMHALGYEFLEVHEARRTRGYGIANGVLQAVGVRKSARREILRRWSRGPLGRLWMRPAGLATTPAPRLLAALPSDRWGHTDLLWTRAFPEAIRE